MHLLPPEPKKSLLKKKKSMCVFVCGDLNWDWINPLVVCESKDIKKVFVFFHTHVVHRLHMAAEPQKGKKMVMEKNMRWQGKLYFNTWHQWVHFSCLIKTTVML